MKVYRVEYHSHISRKVGWVYVAAETRRQVKSAFYEAYPLKGLEFVHATYCPDLNMHNGVVFNHHGVVEETSL